MSTGRLSQVVRSWAKAAVVNHISSAAILASRLSQHTRLGVQIVRRLSIRPSNQAPAPKVARRKASLARNLGLLLLASTGLVASKMWVPTSTDILEKAEAKVLTKVTSEYESRFVELENGETVRMLVFNPGKPGTPLILVHGFGAAVGTWVKNLDTLATDRTVYAFDQVGFGRSSRPKFSPEAKEAEDQLVEGIEQWRRAMGLESFILLGHSLGGYVALSFTLRFPQYVKHLILADPWGMPEQPPDSEQRWGLGFRMIRSVVTRFNLLSILRAVGPAGPSLFARARGDLQAIFSDYFPDKTMMDYMYHCNAQDASGEIAMKSVQMGFGWAVNPMLPRLDELDEKIRMSFIYGEHSWMDPRSGLSAREKLGEERVSIDIVPDATHHVFAQSGIFNALVNYYCQLVDGNPKDKHFGQVGQFKLKPTRYSV